MATPLIITADDLGIDGRRDEGILLAHARHRISHASLLVHGPSARAAAHRARRQGLACGLHLNLTEGEPCAPARAVRSLVGADGRMLGKHGFRAALAAGAVRIAELCAEALAQLDRFAELTASVATHFDGHQHVHVIPAVAYALAPLVAARGVVSTRIPSEVTVRSGDTPTRDFHRRVSDDAACARETYRRHGVRSTAAFVGLDLMGFASSVEGLRGALRTHAGAPSVELMCHPGFVSREGDDFNRSAAREHELRTLLSDAMGALVTREDVAIVSAGELARSGGLA